MTTLDFTITINAPKEKVWDTLWNDASYKAWAAVFSEGSYAETDWEEGSPVRFLTPSGEGMYGIIKRKIPNEQMVFEHHGELKNGKEEPKDWAGATEAYYLEEQDGAVRLSVKMDTTDEYIDFMNNTFPRALSKVKRLAEEF